MRVAAGTVEAAEQSLSLRKRVCILFVLIFDGRWWSTHAFGRIQIGNGICIDARSAAGLHAKTTFLTFAIECETGEADDGNYKNLSRHVELRNQ